MTLSELRRRASGAALVLPIMALFIALSSGGGAIFLALAVGSIGGLALLTWIAATIADAMVDTLKKEH